MSDRPRAQEAPQSVREAGSEWSRLWCELVDLLIEQGTWRTEQRRDLESYVHACRLARFHREQAEAAPYTTHRESGRTFSHPGFQLARDAQREQRALADALVLTPTARKAHGIGDWEPSPFDELDELADRHRARRAALPGLNRDDDALDDALDWPSKDLPDDSWEPPG